MLNGTGVEVNRKLMKHKAFWECQAVARPLVGVVVGGWSRFLQNPGADVLWGEGLLDPELLDPEEFVVDNRMLLEQYEELNDEVYHTAQPFPAVPWLEAIAGCPVQRSSNHLWAQQVPEILERAGDVAYDPTNPWVEKYLEFLDVYGRRLSPDSAIAQSIIRGPADVACALLGEERMVFAFHDEPRRIGLLLEKLTVLAEAFIREQASHVPPFRGGSVIGQFEIWTPGTAVRLQEDALALLSPAIYREFLAPLHARLCGISIYNMFHIHTTSLHILPDLLQVPGMGAIEISKDEGAAGVECMVPSLKQVQRAGRPLLLKGRFDRDELVRLWRELDFNGFCLQVVVDTWIEARETMAFLNSLPAKGI